MENVFKRKIIHNARVFKVAIPPQILKELEIVDKDFVDITLEGDKIVIRKSKENENEK